MFPFHRAWRYGYATPCYSTSCRSTDDERHRERSRDALRHVAFTWHSGPMFGVRRPLRYLAWKLELSEEQTRALVEVLDRLKTAYGQSKLDRDRSTSDIASLFGAASFDADRIDVALEGRTNATRTLNGELSAALRRIFELLDENQRREFAYLLRSGGFTL